MNLRNGWIALFLVAAGFAQDKAPAAKDIPTGPSAIGLGIGRKAPEFSLRDQFGHEQSNESLKGTKGTILVFFRSADW